LQCLQDGFKTTYRLPSLIVFLCDIMANSTPTILLTCYVFHHFYCNRYLQRQTHIQCNFL